MLALFISVGLYVVLFIPTTQSSETSCEEPPEIPLATIEEVSDDSYAIGTTVTYACQFGYSARGRDRTLTCEETDDEDADWTLPQFSCAPQSCGDPGFLNNGRRLGSLFTFPNYVKYECDRGYQLKGLAIRYCQTSGAWSGRVPACEPVTCKPPENPVNGQVVYTSLEYGSELTYKCDAGFHLNTGEAVYCEYNGSWSVPDAQCVESVCITLQNPEHGSMRLVSSDDGHIRAGSIAIFSCDGDRIASGATTSKCLETGQWTFPSPKCLEPCNIPFVNNGAVGRYVREWRTHRVVFKQILVGEKVEDDDTTLYIRCEEGFQVSDSTNVEEQISCGRGKWTFEPSCQPASCLSEPPAVKSAHPMALNPEHGGSVLYACDEGFVKIKNESVTCNHGRWEGTEPICKSNRCSVEELKFPGLVTGRKSYYNDGEVFEVECDSRHSKATNSKYLRCEAGTWKGNFPPCVPAGCTKPPPRIDFGRPEVTSAAHSTVLQYICEPPYVLEENSQSRFQVQCLFGEWEGNPPKCVDSRCRLEDFSDLFHVSKTETSPITLSGAELQVMCNDGYSPKPKKPFCFNGKWNQYDRSPCEENDCTVPFVDHGEMKEKIVGETYWAFWKFRYVTPVHYEKIPATTRIARAGQLHLFCYNGYSFQGTREGIKGITCVKGKWLPAPVCLKIGQRYIPPRTTTRRPVPFTTPKPWRHGTSAAGKNAAETTFISHKTVPETSTQRIFSEVSSVDTTVPDFEKEPPEESCSCSYPTTDENLIAHDDGRRLKFDDVVQNGRVVTFRCKHVGYHIFKGNKEMKCEGCRNWHSDELPTCEEPSTGSAVILHGTLNVSIEGNLEANLGQAIGLKCVAMESSEYPQWTYPSGNGVTVTPERMERESQGDVVYLSNLEIQKADFEHEGSYECAVGDSRKNSVEIFIIDPAITCPRFPNSSEVSVTYEMERRVGSRAFFSCKQLHQQLNGRANISCLRNGKWSGSLPECTDILCKKLEEKDLLSIVYTNDRKIGSRANFHCPSPGKRSGVAFATCLENRMWSDPVPSCPSPPCSLETISEKLPKGVMLLEDNIKRTFAYNTTAKLSCANDMIVAGNPSARCGKHGKWEISDIQCVSGCPPLKKPEDSSLIVQPEKNVYKLGDTITFSCLPGFVLSTESELIMCLMYGWSEAILPQCIENKTFLKQ